MKLSAVMIPLFHPRCEAYNDEWACGTPTRSNLENTSMRT